MAKVVYKKKKLKKRIWSVAIIIAIILIFLFLVPIKTSGCSEPKPTEVFTVIDADPDYEDEECIAKAIKMSMTPMNVNLNEYITNE